MHIHPRSLQDRVFEVWRSPHRFTKNPDMIRLPSGRLLLIYSDTDAHWSREDQVLTLLASDDSGQTWFKHREVARANLQAGEERLVTPRLSRLPDGRLVVLCDHDDDRHFHEDQPPGIWAWWSRDDGDSWSEAQNTGIKGFEPDRMIALPDGRLAVASHLMRGNTQEFAVILSCSEDGGQTWYEAATIAHDGYHRFCEGALVVMEAEAELACVMRENHSAGIPSFVAFSGDSGRSWSVPQMLPFAFHRPYAKPLPDGRVLVTGRHVNGGLGTYAWCGDLYAEAGTYQVGGPRCRYTADLTPKALVIRNQPGNECRYSLLPPESAHSEVLFEAEVKVEGAADQPVAFLSINTLVGRRGTPVVYLASNRVFLMQPGAGFSKPVDMTRYRKVSLHHNRGWLQVRVDGQTLLDTCVFRESARLQDFHGGDVTRRTQFGQYGDVGRSFWRRVAYTVSNPTHAHFDWLWLASEGRWPDEYQRRRLIQVHGNDPDPQPDHGYSSWVRLPDGRVFLVDYTNRGDAPGLSHLVGVYIEPGDLK